MPTASAAHRCAGNAENYALTHQGLCIRLCLLGTHQDSHGELQAIVVDGTLDGRCSGGPLLELGLRTPKVELQARNTGL